MIWADIYRVLGGETALRGDFHLILILICDGQQTLDTPLACRGNTIMQRRVASNFSVWSSGLQVQHNTPLMSDQSAQQHSSTSLTSDPSQLSTPLLLAAGPPPPPHTHTHTHTHPTAIITCIQINDLDTYTHYITNER